LLGFLVDIHGMSKLHQLMNNCYQDMFDSFHLQLRRYQVRKLCIQFERDLHHNHIHNACNSLLRSMSCINQLHMVDTWFHQVRIDQQDIIGKKFVLLQLGYQLDMIHICMNQLMLNRSLVGIVGKYLHNQRIDLVDIEGIVAV